MSDFHSIDDGKGRSLVFALAGQLLEDDDLNAPETDFLKWLDKSLTVDVAIAGDEAAADELNAEEREAWKLFHDAIQATGSLFDLYKSNLPLFQKVAEQLMILPCCIARHPDNQRFNRSLLDTSRLARRNMVPGLYPKEKHLARQSWPVRYAYAVINVVQLTLDTYVDDLSLWADIYGYGVKHPIPLSEYDEAIKQLGWDEAKKRRELAKYEGHYRILPEWTKGIEKLRRPFNKKHVPAYWSKGKEIILEEMPDFHLQPEWDHYRDKRAYQRQGGAKKGAIQHAIFKDILTALRTIAGAGKKKAAKAATKS
jgi:hypothetical protein